MRILSQLRKQWAVFMILPIFLQAVQAQTAAPFAAPGKMDWWRKARFGMFIHWGVYAVPAGVHNGQNVDGLGEWIMHDVNIPRQDYAQYAKQFNPSKYNPEAWVRMAKEAGMKYIVITSKHHDGFALFDSKASDWNVVKATPYGKDLLKPLAEECRKQGMKLGFYYSQANDWYNPGGAAARGHWDDSQKGSMDKYIDEVAIPQVKEILTQYGDVVELWWDVPTDMNNNRASRLDSLLKLQPGIITNDRLGGDYKGDITTPEQWIPATGIPGRDWETCMTINDTWGFKTRDNNWKSTASLIRNLVDIASKGGNYLLNVGPNADGEFPAPIVERLQAIGHWTKVNGDAIYGTTASPFKILPWGRATKRTEGNHTTLYLHVFEWPKDGTLTIPGLKSKVTSARLLASGAAVRTTATADGLVLSVPAVAPDAAVTVIQVDITGPLTIAPFTVKPLPNGSYELLAREADLHPGKDGSSASVEGDRRRMNIGYWTSAQSWVSWNVQAPKPGVYTVKAMAATPAAATAFSIETGKASFITGITSTGDYNQYKEFSLGTIKVSRAGVFTLSVKPSGQNWEAMNLQKMILEPVK